MNCWFVGSDYTCYFDTRLSYVGVRWWPSVLQPSKGKGKGKGKGKVHPRTGHGDPEGEQICSFTLPSTSAPDGGWSTPRPGRFTPGKDPVPIVWETGWAPGPVWTGAENLASPGFNPRTVQSVASRYTD